MTDETNQTDRTKRALAQSAHLGLDVQLLGQGLAPPMVAAVLKLDAAFFRWRGMQQRGDFLSRLTAEVVPGLEPAVFQGLLAVSQHGLGLDGQACAAPTIGDIALRLSLDPSRASRIVAELVTQGYLRREADQADGRKSVLRVTEQGYEALERFRDAKWRLLSELYADWTADEVAAFARLMTKYMDGLTDLLRRG